MARADGKIKNPYVRCKGPSGERGGKKKKGEGNSVQTLTQRQYSIKQRDLNGTAGLTGQR